MAFIAFPLILDVKVQFMSILSSFTCWLACWQPVTKTAPIQRNINKPSHEI